MNIIDPEKIKLAAAAIANARGGRRGMPPVKNILELLPQKLVDEVTEDAEATLHAVGDHLTIHVLQTQRDELLAALKEAAAWISAPMRERKMIDPARLCAVIAKTEGFVP